ncbi:hypothetical protein BJ684DRAFT_18515 [Piptocephalis cylindrospora]|uniref:Uncharacterized protein n=1 Tax=Piptocephalis cylindrospora TaxID=1907219 RepID=A0A4P9Y8L8_9FUNG|nr:hypothetical protein BJ684DRAFT_18515 [Piptocephalis cylindrospora]|eukprot:RKP15144.1 hypothetical protein BJ684DRAFT_18515 [Piptocephalis cylindrospora]
MRSFTITLSALAAIALSINPVYAGYGWYYPETVTQTTTVSVTAPPVTQTESYTVTQGPTITLPPITTTKTKTVTKTVTPAPVTRTKTITVTAAPTSVDPSATEDPSSPTSTFTNPPPPPAAGSSSTYLFSIKNPENNFNAFDAEFKQAIAKANDALDNPNANTITTTLKLSNFVSYTAVISLDVYNWILHDSRINTFDADGSGHT